MIFCNAEGLPRINIQQFFEGNDLMNFIFDE